MTSNTSVPQEIRTFSKELLRGNKRPFISRTSQDGFFHTHVGSSSFQEEENLTFVRFLFSTVPRLSIIVPDESDILNYLYQQNQPNFEPAEESTILSQKIEFRKLEKGCSICQGTPEDEEEDSDIKILPCGDEFHAECIDQWLRVHNKCPNCCNSL